MLYYLIRLGVLVNRVVNKLDVEGLSLDFSTIYQVVFLAFLVDKSI